jgi:predicted metal-dependent phosphoesterase TrpH
MATVPKRLLRGIIHCHSKYSYDSVTSIGSYLRFARKHNLDFIIVTDHDSTKGSQALREAAAMHMPSLNVPLAAEYLTDCGDIIAVFLKSELQARTLDEAVSEARAQGAILLFPHPYVSHKEIRRMAEVCDLIEVFNARASDGQNKKAADLAASVGKVVYAGADAHLSNSLGRVIVQVDDHGDLRASLLKGKMSWVCEKTPKWEIAASQAIKAYKRRDIFVAWNLVRGGARYMWRRLAGQTSGEAVQSLVGNQEGGEKQ